MKNAINKLNASLVLASIIVLFFITSCNSPAEKVENAQEDVVEAEQDLTEAQNDYSKEFENFKKEMDEKIATNDKKIAEINASMLKEKKSVQDENKEKIAILEQRNVNIKQRMSEYKDDGNEKWQSFKREFSHDMDELGESLKNFNHNDKK